MVWKSPPKLPASNKPSGGHHYHYSQGDMERHCVWPLGVCSVGTGTEEGRTQWFDRLEPWRAAQGKETHLCKSHFCALKEEARKMFLLGAQEREGVGEGVCQVCGLISSPSIGSPEHHHS